MDQCKELLSRYTQEYALDESTRVKAEELYREYMNRTTNQHNVNNENYPHLMMRIAILIASRSQEYKTIDNITVRGSDMSVTQFLRGSPEISIDDFIFNMTVFLDQVKLDQLVLNDCQNILRDFNLALTVFNKFEELWAKMGIKDKSLSKASAEKIKKIAWLIFIIAKVRILQRRGDLVEFAYLLVAVLILIIQLLPEEVSCDFVNNFKRENSQIDNQKELGNSFQKHIITYFKNTIKAHDEEPIIVTKESLQEMMLKLKQRDLIKGLIPDSNHTELHFMDLELQCQIPSKCLHGILNSDNLANNFKKLDSIYQQKLQTQELDDRHFINSDNRNLTPFKLSPFARHSIYNQKQAPATPQKQISNENTLEPPNKRVLHSQRLLNYDQSTSSKMENAASVSLEQKLTEIKFPQRVPNSPYSIKQITPATPISMMMELKNWLKQNLNRVCMNQEHGVSKVVHDFIQPQNQESKIQIIQVVSNEIEKNFRLVIQLLAEREGKKDDKNLQDAFYQQYGNDTKLLTFRILDELLIKEYRTSQQQQRAPDFSHLLQKDIFLKSVFVCALETVFFIQMVKKVQVHDILPIINLKAFDLWRLLNSFLKFDQQMPKSLNDHFRDIEIRIVSEAAWANGSPVVEIIRQVFQEQQRSSLNQNQTKAEDEQMKLRQEQIMQSYNMFFKRVLHLAAQRILDLGAQLQLSEDVLEKVWVIMKCQLGHEPQLLVNRHLDQFVMCTIYCVCKIQPELQISFNNIINKYAEIQKNQRNFQNIYLQVLILNGERKDIISFYNEVYIKIMKEYITYIKPNFAQQQQSQLNMIQNSNTPLGSRTPQILRQPMLTPSINKPSIKVLCPESPLKSSLPPPIMQYNTIFQQNPRSNHQTPLIPNRYMQSPLHPHMTPRTIQLYAFGETPSGELGKISSMFNKNAQIGSNGQNNTFQQPPPIGLGSSSNFKNLIIQNIKNKKEDSGTTGLPEPQILLTINRNTLPKIGVGLINISNNSGEPKINKKMINPLIKPPLSRKDSDHQMAEPQIQSMGQLSNMIKQEKDEKTVSSQPQKESSTSNNQILQK